MGWHDHRVTADGKGTVVVLVRVAPCFRFFTTEGAPIRQWGDKELFTGEAHSVHFGPDGNVWATDSVEHTVRKFSSDRPVVADVRQNKVAGDNASQDTFNGRNAVAFGHVARSSSPTATRISAWSNSRPRESSSNIRRQEGQG